MTTCCKTAETSRKLDAELAQGFPTSAAPSLTEPAGDVRGYVASVKSPAVA